MENLGDILVALRREKSEVGWSKVITSLTLHSSVFPVGPFLSNCKARLMILDQHLVLDETICKQLSISESHLYFMAQ